MVCLGNELRSFCHFWGCTQVLHFGLLLIMRATSSMGFLPIVVDIMVIWIKLVHSHFSPLIPKMLMFSLTISCLTTSNLPWFMDLTFQVRMQYCSLQHWILLSSPDISTTESHFHCGPTASLFLGLLVVLLHSSPVAAGYLQTWQIHIQCPIFLSFYTVHVVPMARILGWFAIPSSSGPHFVRTLHCDLSVLGSLTQNGS